MDRALFTEHTKPACRCRELGRVYCFFDRYVKSDKGTWKEPHIGLDGYRLDVQVQYVIRKD